MSTSNDFNYPLYNYAVGWFRRRPVNPLTFIAPIVTTDGRIGTFKRYNQGDVFRRVDTRRPLYQTATSMNISADDPAYALQDHSLRIPIADAELKPGAGSKEEASTQKSMAKMGSLLTTWETSFVADGFDFFRANVTAEAGKGKWSSPDSNPVKEFKDLINSFRDNNGVYPNRILIPDGAWDILGENAEIKDRMAFADAKTLDIPLLKILLGLTADKVGEEVQIKTGHVPIGTAEPGPGVPFEGINLLGADIWMVYAQDGLAIDDISGLKTFSDGGADIVSNVESYYERNIKTTWHEIEMFRSFQVTAPSCVRRLSIS